MFSFDDKSSPTALMDELERFIDHFAGPRRPEYGEPEAIHRPLPEPLRRLYLFAGRWGPRDPRAHWEGFGAHDHLRQLSRAEDTDDGKVVFLNETQGVWHCATLQHGEDPPVWCDWQYLGGKFKRKRRDPWFKVADSLAQFLVTYCLQESLHGCRFRSTDDQLAAMYRADLENSVPVLTEGVYVHAESVPVFRLYRNDILVGTRGDWLMLGANSNEAMNFLSAHRSPIAVVGFYVPPGWHLDIRSDGSAEVSNRYGSPPALALIPPGTFDFAGVVANVQESWFSNDLGGLKELFQLPDRKHVQVLFARIGEPHAENWFIKDWEFTERLFRQAFASAEINNVLERQRDEGPPFA